MSRVPHILRLLPAALASAACGDAASRDKALTQSIAADFRKECESSGGPTEAMRAHLVRLCGCTEAKIVANPIPFGEKDAAISDRIRAASQACLDELGGAPGAKVP